MQRIRLFHLLLLVLAACGSLVAQDRSPSRNIVYPPGAFTQNGGRIIDVTQPPYNATGDGVTDDTDAIKAAYNFIAQSFQDNGWQSSSNNMASWMLYFPAGTYLVSDVLIHDLTISFPGTRESNPEGIAWVRFVGQNRENTIIKLRNNAPGYGPGAGKPVVSFQALNRGEREGTNIPGANQLSDLTIDTGTGNPGAIGALFISANVGMVDNVHIRSGDGQGFVGLDLPFLSVQGHYRDITVEGFDYGIRTVTRGEVNPALEYVSLSGQNIAAFLTEDGCPSMRRVSSNNSVPFLQMVGDEAHVVLIESELLGGAAGEVAIDLQDDRSQVFARDVTVGGYSTTVRKAGENVLTGNIDEYVSDQPYTLFNGFPARSLNLPVAESPMLDWEEDLSQWANVDDYPGDTDGERIQNAMNSGLPVVYFPRSRYVFDDPITIPATVRHIEFLYSRTNDNAEFIIDESSSEPLFIDHTNRNRSVITQATPRTVVLRNCSWNNYFITTTEPTTLFIESAGGIGKAENFCPPNATIWARAPNDEIKSTSNFKVFGGQMWTMGFKTESETPAFEVRDGGTLEVLGGFRNDIARVVEAPMVVSENSTVSFVGYTFLTSGGEPAVVETQVGIEQTLFRSELPGRGGSSYYIPLFVGSTDATAPDCLDPLTGSATTTVTRSSLTWEDRNGNSESFDVRYRIAGTVAWTTVTGVAANSLDLSGLEAATNYEWEVRAQCTDQNSEWSPTFEFVTDLEVEITDTAPVIDGATDDPVWTIDVAANKLATGTINNDVTFGLLWDEDFLYVGVEVLDNNLFNDSEETFRDDAVEVYIDVNNNDGPYDAQDIQITKGYADDGLDIDASFAGTVQHDWADIPGGYSIELAIPWSGLGIVPADEFNLGFDVGINDDDDGDARDGQQVWAGNSSNFRNTEGFGDIILQGPPLDEEEALRLYYTYDDVTDDEIEGLQSTFGPVAGFGVQSVSGPTSAGITDDGSTAATDAAIAIENGSLLNASFTTRSYAFWTKVDDTQANQLLFEEGGDGGGAGIEVVGDELRIIFRNAGGGQGFTALNVPFSAANATTDGWHHVAVTYNSGNIRAYVNGAEAGSTTGTASSIPNHSNPPSLGGIRNNQSPTNTNPVYLSGFIDEFRVYDAVLTPSIIARLATVPTRETTETGIRFSQSSIEGAVDGAGASGQISAYLWPSIVFSSSSLEFSSSDPSVVTIDQQGNYQLMGGGAAEIIATEIGNPELRATIPVTSSDPSQFFLTDVDFVCDTLIVAPDGGSFVATVTTAPELADIPEVAFSSLDEDIFTVDAQTGRITSASGTSAGQSGHIVVTGLDDRADPGNPPADTAVVYLSPLALHWSLEDQTGTIVENVAPGDGRDGTVIGGTVDDLAGEGIVGDGFVFDPPAPAEGPIVGLSKQIVSGYPLSASGWVRITRPQFSQLFTLNDSTVNRNFLSIGITNLNNPDGSQGTQAFILADDGNIGRRVNSEIDIRGGWHFLTAVYASPTQRQLYVDGVLAVDDDRPAEGITFENQRLTLGSGRRGTFDSQRYFGDADEFKVWTVALCPDDIDAMRVAPTALEVEPVDELQLGDEDIPLTVSLTPIFSIQALSFSSSDPSIVSVDADGFLTATGLGTARITVASAADPSVSQTVEVNVPFPAIGDCQLAAADFPDAQRIVAVSPVTYADFSRNRGTYVIGVATGIRADGRAGAWEIHNDCSVQTIRRSGNQNRTTLLPDIKGVERNRNWQYTPTRISEDGQFIFGVARNEEGFTHKRGWRVEPGTEVDIRWKLGSPFYGRIFGVNGEILCEDLEVRTFASNFFVIRCNDDAPSSQQRPTFQEAFSPALDGESLPVRLYPNPASSFLRLDGIEGPVDISIFSVDGRQLLSRTINGQSPIDVSTLVPGTYRLRLESDREVPLQFTFLIH